MKRSFDQVSQSSEPVPAISAADAIRAAAKAAALQAQILSRTGETNTLTIKCPQSAVGKVIGKRGETIAQLQAQTGCNVQVDQTTKETGHSTLHLSAKNRESLLKCKTHLEALIASTQPIGLKASSDSLILATTAPLEEEKSEQETIDVPEASVGILIGPKGIVIHQMMMEFEVHMWIDQSMSPGLPRKLAVLGTRKNCDRAITRVQEILAGTFNPAQAALENSVSTNYYKYQTQILQAFQDTANAEAVVERHVLLTTPDWGIRIEGKRGQLLQQIRTQSAASVSLTREDDQVRIEISGPQFAASRALQLIKERIPHEQLTESQAPPPRADKAWFENPWEATSKITEAEANALSEDWKRFASIT